VANRSLLLNVRISTYVFRVIQSFLDCFCDRPLAKNAQSVAFIVHHLMIIGPQPYKRIMRRICHRSLSGQNNSNRHCCHMCRLFQIVEKYK